MITNYPKLMQTLYALLWLTLWINFSAHAKPEWILEKEESNVSIHSRMTDTGYIEVKVKTQINTSPFALLKVLDDTAAACEWIAHCRSVEIMDWFANTRRTVRTNFSAPWPVKDRDMITASTAQIDRQQQSINIVITDKGQEYATLSNYQRMENVRGTWNTQRLENGMVEIEYIGYGEAAGSIPIWLANRLLISSTLDTFVNLRKVIVLEKYQNHSPSQITE